MGYGQYTPGDDIRSGRRAAWRQAALAAALIAIAVTDIITDTIPIWGAVLLLAGAGLLFYEIRYLLATRRHR